MKRILRNGVLAVLAAALWWVPAYGAHEVPESIRIGLAFGSPALETARVESDTGFEFGIVEKDVYRPLYYLIDFEALAFEKGSPGADEAACLVQIGPAATDPAELFDLLETGSEAGSVFPVFDDGWRVCAGPFESETKAGSEAKRLAELLDGTETETRLLEAPVLVVSGEDILLAFDSREAEYLLKPFEEKDGEPVFSYGGRTYRGGLMAKRFKESDLTLINYLDLQAYLYGVLPREMAKDWPLEALKAQAVAARNFAVANYNKYAHLGFNLCATVNSQVYGGYGCEGPVSNRAVDETKGKLLTWEGRVFSAFYHSNSGGHTESSENVWSAALPYIRGVRDDFSIGAPHSSWRLEYTGEEAAGVLSASGYDVGRSVNLSVLSRSENLHVVSLLVESDRLEFVLEKNAIRSVFGYNTLRSTYFDLMKDNDLFLMDGAFQTGRNPAKGLSVLSADGGVQVLHEETCHLRGAAGERQNPLPGGFVFEGRGWGHGLGMSQWGAKKMAEEGYGYEDILAFYYRDTHIE